jgi:imidazolonepropionase-like amidohydrolase
VDESKIDELAQKVKRANIYVTATNYFFTKYFGMGATKEEIEHFACYEYVPAFMKKRGDESFKYYWDNPPSEELRKKYVRIRYEFATSLYNAGVKLMTGSDGPEWYLAPGFTVHDEIESYVKAGLSNFAALQTATINPATYLGIDNRKGTLEAGKEGDFILLEKNPLEDIKNTRTIKAVYTGKRFYTRTQLDRLLNEARIIVEADNKN